LVSLKNKKKKKKQFINDIYLGVGRNRFYRDLRFTSKGGVGKRERKFIAWM
jgi:hypothetical protein